MTRRISSCRYLVPLAVVLALWLTLTAVPALGLSVSNAMVLGNVNPGETFTHAMTIGIDSGAEAVDISVEVTGVQQSPGGRLDLVDASSDTSPYSARQFVTVDKASFRLEPGGSEEVTATVTVPQDVGDGGRYAIIHIVTEPVDTGGVGMASAVNVPVYLTVKDSQLIHSGVITGVVSGEVSSGQPISIVTDFQNTGNHHFKVKGEVTVSNDRGQELGVITTPVTSSSILPGMIRQLEASFIPGIVLPSGTYTVDSRVMLEDGTALDQSSTAFEVTDPYTAPPGTLVISSLNSSGITKHSATITWTTNEAATSKVEYGPTQGWGSSTTLEALVTSHRVELAGLEADTTYHYRVISRDAADSEAASLDQTFTTATISGGMPVWAWAIIAVAGVGVAGSAAFFVGKKAKK